MYDNDYVSFSGSYKLEEDLSFSPDELLGDTAVDFTGNDLSYPPNSKYAFGRDQWQDIPGKYSPYYDNFNQSQKFILRDDNNPTKNRYIGYTDYHNNLYPNKANALIDRFNLSGNKNFDCPGNRYQYQSYEGDTKKYNK